jgi:antitoxin MazE
MYIHCRYSMNTTIQKWGNSLALRIPQAIARQIHVSAGDDVELSVDLDGLLVRPARRRYQLAQLVRKITPANRHAETPWGKSVGKEL